MKIVLSEELANLAERIEAGDVTHEDVVDMMQKGMKSVGRPCPPREEMLGKVRARFATAAEVQDFMRTAMATYLAMLLQTQNEGGTKH